MAKGIREKIKLVSSAGTGHFYTTTKNKRTKPEKLRSGGVFCYLLTPILIASVHSWRCYA